MEGVYFYHRDMEAATRNSIGVLLVKDLNGNFEKLYLCDEYSSFYAELVDGSPRREVSLKKPNISPMTLSDICRAGMIDLIDGVIYYEFGRKIHVRFK